MEELRELGTKVRKNEVESARQEIINKANKLKEDGKIHFPWEETLV
ncbi:MAG: hypothetical protein K2X39_00635 [Silvanigrellaceae bacterium]|nr:hypothetical protein [Silvanigrellaceae bacterium]